VWEDDDRREPGAALAERGAQVLVIDLDPQSNSTSGLGIDPSRARLTSITCCRARPASTRWRRPRQCRAARGASQVALAGAGSSWWGKRPRGPVASSSLGLTGGFGYVLIDCAPRWSPDADALAAADQRWSLAGRVLRAGGPRPPPVHPAAVRMNLNPKLELAGILITQFDARTTLSWDVLNGAPGLIGQAVPDAYPAQRSGERGVQTTVTGHDSTIPRAGCPAFGQLARRS